MHRSLLTSVAVLAVSLPSLVYGEIIDSDRTLDEAYTGKHIVVRDGLTPPTVVNIDGANLETAHTEDTSILNISAGEFVPQLPRPVIVTAWHDSTVNMRDGFVNGAGTEYAVRIRNNSTMNMEGGTVVGGTTSILRAEGEANVNISGGHIYGHEANPVVSFGGDHLAISGGQIGPLTWDFSAGGTMVSVSGDSTAEITGGVLTGKGMSSTGMLAQDNATAETAPRPVGERAGSSSVTRRPLTARIES